MKHFACLLLLLILTLTSCAPSFTARRLAPAEYRINGIRTLSIAPFSSESARLDRWATLARREFVSKVNASRFYSIVEGMPDTGGVFVFGKDTSPPWRVWGEEKDVDAIIAGHISSAGVNTKRESKKIEEEISTGKYRMEPVIENGVKQLRKVEIKEKRVRYEPIVTKRAHLILDITFLNVRDGTLMMKDSISESDEKKGEGESEVNSLPTDGEMAESLCSKATTRLANKIVPHEILYSLSLIKDKSCKDGIKMARNNDWAGAIESWQSVNNMTPQNSAAIYNIAIAEEMQGNYESAQESYRRSCAIKTNKRCEEAIRRVNDIIKQNEILKDQLKDR